MGQQLHKKNSLEKQGCFFSQGNLTFKYVEGKRFKFIEENVVSFFFIEEILLMEKMVINCKKKKTGLYD